MSNKGSMKTELINQVYIRDEDNFLKKVHLKDIYYIETIKSTHYCRVVHKQGEGKIHADITPLEKQFDGKLFKTRSSTLINVDLVQKIDTKNRLICFNKHICCSYAQRMSRKLKEKLGIADLKRR